MNPEAAAFNAVLAGKVRVLLARLEAGETVSTATLIAAIVISPREAEERAYKALKVLATGELADCARRGPVEIVKVRGRGGRWMSKRRQPWLWALYGSPNDEAKRCPHCGGVL